MLASAADVASGAMLMPVIVDAALFIELSRITDILYKFSGLTSNVIYVLHAGVCNMVV